MIYFDHNATAPMLPEARQAWLEAAEQFIGNPSSPHRLGSRAEAALSEARERLASFLGCDALDIVWTSGATEANNIFLHHFASSSDETREIWISALEHPSVLAPAKARLAGRLRLIPATRQGVPDLEWLRNQFSQARPAAVVAMAANNETGVLQPWRDILELCRQHETPYCCDATQWMGKLPANSLGHCDFVSGSAHKFGGPKGVGFLKCAARGRLHPLMLGGKQEEGRRAGTENVASILSMMAALEIRERQLKSDGVQTKLSIRNHFERELMRRLPGAAIVGESQERLWNTVSAMMPQADCRQRWVVKLDKLRFAVSTGSACASGQEEPSHVLNAMGYAAEEASRVLRFSSGWETPNEAWDQLLEALQEVYAPARGRPRPQRVGEFD